MPGKIHVRTWSGCQSARITDMANAAKRGKKCQVLRIQGYGGRPVSSDGDRVADQSSWEIMRLFADAAGVEMNDPVNHVVDGDFSAVASHVKKIVAGARASGAQEWQIGCYEEEIRGVDAPRPKLMAGNDKWSGSADEGGIHLADLTDHYNEPRVITAPGQQNSRAYEIAAKVWDQVKQAATIHDAAGILGGAGARLHSYCAMD